MSNVMECEARVLIGSQKETSDIEKAIEQMTIASDMIIIKVLTFSNISTLTPPDLGKIGQSSTISSPSPSISTSFMRFPFLRTLRPI